MIKGGGRLCETTVFGYLICEHVVCGRVRAEKRAGPARLWKTTAATIAKHLLINIFIRLQLDKNETFWIQAVFAFGLVFFVVYLEGLFSSSSST